MLWLRNLKMWTFARYGVVAAFIQALLLFSTPVFAQDRLVVAFGDSLTAGYGLKLTESFPSQLEAKLRKNGIMASVRNAGVSGDTTAAGRARLAWVLGSLKVKPRLVILELGANDMLRGLSPAQTRANLEAMLVELKRQGIPVILAGMRASPNMGKAYQAQFDVIYPDLAVKYGARLYPFFMAGVAAQRALLIADGMHPNPSGVGIIVGGIYPLVAAGLR
jgi:acyl-CoA thioesterase I